VEVTASNVQFRKGDDVTVQLNIPDIESLAGLQFTFAWDQNVMEFASVVPNSGLEVSLNNFGLHSVKDGLITASWHTTSNFMLPSDQQKNIGTFRFKALADGQLRDIIHLTSAITKNEVYYKKSTDINELSLSVLDGEEGQYFALYQNVPNPWSNQTTIAFHLPSADDVQLLFFDENGRTVKVINQNFEQGHNEVVISEEEFNSGIYYYRLETASHTSTRKMVLMN